MTDFEQYLYRLYHNCIQGHRNVAEYTSKFMRLAECYLDEINSQQMARYMNGLRPSIQDQIRLQTFWIVQEANNMALKANLMENERWSSSRNFQKKYTDSPVSTKDKGKEVEQVLGNNNTNKWQGIKGATESSSNIGDICFQRQNPYAKLYGDHCYHNGKLGHKSNDCPNRRQVYLAEVDEDDNEDHGVDEEYDEADFAYEEGDEVINIVLQRVLLAPRHEEGHRHKIFQSLCTINNKVWNLIIDGSSC